MPVADLDPAASDGLEHAADEGLDDAGAGAPGDVEAGDGVAVARGGVATALGPLHDGEEAHALAVQPVAVLAGGEGDVGPGPLPGPEVLGPVEGRRAHPVGERELGGVVDAQPALLG